MRMIATAVIDPNIGLHHSGPIVCEERLCTIQVREGGEVERCKGSDDSGPRVAGVRVWRSRNAARARGRCVDQG
jgi:hypothetical protein